MSLIGLPLELLEEIIDYAIPENWECSQEWQLVRNLRLVCCK